MIREIISRKEARIQGLKRYFTGKPCKHGHVDERHVSSKGCYTCCLAGSRFKYKEKLTISGRQYRQANREKIRARSLAWGSQHIEWVRARYREWGRQNIDKLRATSAKRYLEHKEQYTTNSDRWRRENPDRYKNNHRRWRVTNSDKVNSYWAKHHAAKLRAVPSWLTATDWRMINALYGLSCALTQTTGVMWHVDHIIPLQGKNVCGLHVPGNLRVIPAHVNLSKSNKFIEVLAA